MKNRLRALPAIASALVLVLGLSACSNSGEATDTADASNPAATSSTTAASNSTAAETESTVATDSESSGSTETPDSTDGTGSAGASGPESTTAGGDSAGIALGGPEQSAPTGKENVDLRADPYADITAGDQITLQVSGLNPAVGYHAAICAAEQPQGSPVPTCTGAGTDTSAQAWLKAGGGTAEISPEGTAEVTLTATPTGEGLDCTVDACVIKIFGDQTEGFRNVADLPVSFAAA